jgi:hypothetical protein
MKYSNQYNAEIGMLIAEVFSKCRTLYHSAFGTSTSALLNPFINKLDRFAAGFAELYFLYLFGSHIFNVRTYPQPCL